MTDTITNNNNTSLFNKQGRIPHDNIEEEVIKVQTLLSEDEEKYLSEVGYMFREKVLAYKKLNSKRGVKKSYVNTTDVLLYLVENMITLSEKEDKGNVLKVLIKFMNKDKVVVDRTRVGILVKINSLHHHNLLKLERIVIDNEFGLDIRFISKFMQFVIYASKHYYLVLE